MLLTGCLATSLSFPSHFANFINPNTIVRLGLWIGSCQLPASAAYKGKYQYPLAGTETLYELLSLQRIVNLLELKAPLHDMFKIRHLIIARLQQADVEIDRVHLILMHLCFGDVDKPLVGFAIARFIEQVHTVCPDPYGGLWADIDEFWATYYPALIPIVNDIYMEYEVALYMNFQDPSNFPTISELAWKHFCVSTRVVGAKSAGKARSGNGFGVKAPAHKAQHVNGGRMVQNSGKKHKGSKPQIPNQQKSTSQAEALPDARTPVRGSVKGTAPLEQIKKHLAKNVNVKVVIKEKTNNTNGKQSKVDTNNGKHPKVHVEGGTHPKATVNDGNQLKTSNHVE
ncbi:hypothetical protein EJ06DRAFT_308063 [Trichodelitschia bisporula]|uniref:Uncharacterized protein n=1 Tax=Trichodelitschia bisporula TaxID=703511 RepID=A0A6G1I3W9_9PEZI|nr:hypothetical protein EJ06DRAFT_308063 [Trichodelitschia bisporula]